VVVREATPMTTTKTTETTYTQTNADGVVTFEATRDDDVTIWLYTPELGKTTHKFPTCADANAAWLSIILK